MESYEDNILDEDRVRNLPRNSSPKNTDKGCSDSNIIFAMQLKLTGLRIVLTENEIELEMIKLESKSLKVIKEEVNQSAVCSSGICFDKAREFKNYAASHLHGQCEDLPKKELMKFDGSPLKYWLYIWNFITDVEKKSCDDETRLSYLILCCEKDAKEAIEHCSILEPEGGYMEAKRILRKRFGRSCLISKAYVDQLLDGPVINSDDAKALVKLSELMKACETTVKQLYGESDINSSRSVNAIVRRLPNYLQIKWAEKVTVIKRDVRNPIFSELASFVEDSAEVAVNRLDIKYDAPLVN